MSQSATELVKDAIGRKVKEVEAASQEARDQRESPDSGDDRAISRSELEDVVREGVREGLAEYEREAASEEGERSGTDVDPTEVDLAPDDSQDDESSSGGSARPLLLLIGLAVAAVLYRRRRSSDDDRSPDY